MPKVRMTHNILYYKLETPYVKSFYPLVSRNGFPLMQFLYTRARDAVAHTERNLAKTKNRRLRWTERGKEYSQAVTDRLKLLKKAQIIHEETIKAANKPIKESEDGQ